MKQQRLEVDSGAFENVGRISIGKNGVVRMGAGVAFTVGVGQFSLPAYIENNGEIFGDVFIKPGGSLFGAGTTYGNIIFDTGSMLRPGASAGLGRMAVGSNLSLLAGSQIDIGINNVLGARGTTDGWGEIVVGGTVDVQGLATNPIRLRLNGLNANSSSGMPLNFNATQPFSIPIIQAAEGISGFLAAAFRIDLTGFGGGVSASQFRLQQESNGLVLSYLPGGVPNIAGDFDSDGDVDGSDFLLWQQNPTGRSLGDWRTNFGERGVSVVGVPEPSALIQFTICAFMVVLGRGFGRREAHRCS